MSAAACLYRGDGRWPGSAPVSSSDQSCDWARLGSAPLSWFVVSRMTSSTASVSDSRCPLLFPLSFSTIDVFSPASAKLKVDCPREWPPKK